MKLLNQPLDGALGDKLKSLLRSGEFSKLNIVVAFAKNSGVQRLINDFDDFIKSGGEINVYVGVDFDGTTYEALSALLPRTTSLFIIHAENEQTFHSKIYNFTGEDKNLLIVGSNNFTRGGLWTNMESSLIVSSDKKDDTTVQDEFISYIQSLRSLNKSKSCMQINSQNDIDLLLRNGYIKTEIETLIKNKSKKYGGSRNVHPLFGNGVRAKLPSLIKGPDSNSSISPFPDSRLESKTDAFTSTGADDETDETIWLETRKMTGGSRNILDLSAKSLLYSGNPEGTVYDIGTENYISGAVRFFGIDPINTKISKDIIINYNGIDYYGNTILFPKGKKANGTWRLQLKGRDASGNKITGQLKLNGNPSLPHKIITFTRVRDDCYSMSIFPDSKLSRFEKVSWLLAFNGSTNKARRLGIIKND
ncbi:hypothetical protein BA20089_06725 [Bifidobacterium asteroides DSM 20089]|uniref:Restriction endonuclease type II NgoFVII N-terminal domain-containing protein n=1 Tax=Bifidobacterium asteroides DSM 20089 TaxID=1437594 RepID=A0AAD0ABS7_9BIFI|nr:phospholipase D family protein [Bifidobacterium asteroides]AFU72053.1 hypothetical protein with NgoFVII restriction endonuclease domain [Bifidobacterium asteroides PRL2011]ATO41846.1 hypothetical protein BA20089_06725 [Bifidobacterium asteroides DSM 20089]